MASVIDRFGTYLQKLIALPVRLGDTTRNAFDPEMARLKAGDTNAYEEITTRLEGIGISEYHISVMNKIWKKDLLSASAAEAASTNSPTGGKPEVYYEQLLTKTGVSKSVISIRSPASPDGSGIGLIDYRKVEATAISALLEDHNLMAVFGYVGFHLKEEWFRAMKHHLSTIQGSSWKTEIVSIDFPYVERLEEAFHDPSKSGAIILDFARIGYRKKNDRLISFLRDSFLRVALEEPYPQRNIIIAGEGFGLDEGAITNRLRPFIDHLSPNEEVVLPALIMHLKLLNAKQAGELLWGEDYKEEEEYRLEHEIDIMRHLWRSLPMLPTVLERLRERFDEVESMDDVMTIIDDEGSRYSHPGDEVHTLRPLLVSIPPGRTADRYMDARMRLAAEENVQIRMDEGTGSHDVFRISMSTRSRPGGSGGGGGRNMSGSSSPAAGAMRSMSFSGRIFAGM